MSPHGAYGLFDAFDARCFDREPMLRAVAMLLGVLRGRFRFLTIPELLRRGSADRQPWFRRADPKRLNRLQRSVGDARRYADEARVHRGARPDDLPRRPQD